MCIGIVSEIYFLEINGVVLIVYSLVVGFVVQGYMVEVICLCQLVLFVDEFGMLLVEICGVVLFCYLGLCFGLFSGCMLCKCWNCLWLDVIYVVMEGFLGWLVMCVVQQLGIFVVIGFYMCFDIYVVYYGVGFFIEVVCGYLCCFYNCGGVILVFIEVFKCELGVLGVVNVCILCCVVDIEQFYFCYCDVELCWQWGVGGYVLVVFYVGCIVVEKNFDLVVCVFCVVQQCLFDVCYVWVGDGLVWVVLQVVNLDFIFVGMQCGELLVWYVVSVDVFFFFSFSEIFGNVIFEVFVVGLLVVVYCEGVVCEYMEYGSNGYVIELGDEVGFIDVMVMFVGNFSLICYMGCVVYVSVVVLLLELVICDFEFLLIQFVWESYYVQFVVVCVYV